MIIKIITRPEDQTSCKLTRKTTKRILLYNGFRHSDQPEDRIKRETKQKKRQILDFAWELKKELRNMSVTVIPAVVVALENGP